MFRMAFFIIGISLALAGVAAALSQDEASETTLEISGPEQSIEAFTRGWRRLRKYTRACGVNESYQATIGIAEGYLGTEKYEQQKNLGKKLKGDSKAYMLGHADNINVTYKGCKKALKEVEPILKEFYEKLKAREKVPLYKAPKVR